MLFNFSTIPVAFTVKIPTIIFSTGYAQTQVPNRIRVYVCSGGAWRSDPRDRPDTSYVWACVCVCVFVVPWKFKQVQLQQLEWRLDVQPAPCTQYQAPCTTQSGSDRRGKLRYQRRFTVSGNPFRTLCSAFGKSAQWHLLSAKGE